MLFNLDKLVSCDRPVDCILWVGLLAFHQALVSNPQDAFVIWVFASVLYNGKWDEGVKFAREHAKDQVNFAPEISGFSEIESDEELAAKVTELASLVQDCVDGLNETHSYMVFVSKKIKGNVRQIFDVLVNSTEPYSRGRKTFMIDYHLLGKGHLPETRFVLGKIILKTISGGLAGGEREVDEEKKTIGGEREVDEEKKTKSLLDSIEESCQPRPCDSTKNEFSSKKNRKHSLAIPDSESNFKRTKKPKLSGKKCRLFEQELNMNKQDKVSKEECHQQGKEHWNLVETSQLAKEETNMTQKNILEKKDCHTSLEEVISKKINKHKNVVKEKNSSRIKKQKLSRKKRILSEQELNMNKQDKVSKEECHQKGKELRNLVETCLLAKEETKMTQESISEKKDCHSSLEEVISKKINKHKNIVKEKSSIRPPLSSLFK